MRAFLAHVEQERGCLPQTRNQRLSAVRTRFVASRDPEQFDRTSQVRAIPLKKTAQQPVAYLEKPEIEALPTVPDPARPHGPVASMPCCCSCTTPGRACPRRRNCGSAICTWATRAAATATLRGQGGKTRQVPALASHGPAAGGTGGRALLARARLPEPSAAVVHALRDPGAGPAALGERSMACMYETGGLRRVYLRGHSNMLKRLLVPVSACNLGVLMRSLTGTGTPRSLQGHHLAAVFAPERLGNALLEALRELLRARRNLRPGFRLSSHPESGLYAA